MAFGAIGGGIAGGQPDVVSQGQSYSVDAPFSTYGDQTGSAAFTAFQNYNGIAGTQSKFNSMGPAMYAQMLQQYAQTGGLPNANQINYANEYAQNIFAPQQAALNNVFTQSQIDANRKAAAMGRPINDPILQAKLAQYMGQQQNVLSGQQTALGAQTAAQLPRQQLGYAEALSNQAFKNQADIYGLGMQYLKNQQDWALSLATRNQTATGTSGGGTKGTVAGIFQGAGAETNLFGNVIHGSNPFGNSGAPSGGGGGGGGYAASAFGGGEAAGAGAGAGGGAATGGYAGAVGLAAAAA